MTLDEAVNDLKTKVTAISAGAVVKVMRVSDEEARVSIYAPAEHVTPLQDATREPTIQWLAKDGLDVQVFVYDSATTKPPE
jgi:hypothetical protein